MKQYDVIIIGGGLAGLTAALHLTKENYHVLVLEKHRYPHHKVCGEYVSNEIKPYLQHLGISLSNAVAIDSLLLSTVKGKSLEVKLPLGGMGISRYHLDHLLYLEAERAGAAVQFEGVTTVDFSSNEFQVVTDAKTKYKAPVVIGAYGKRSSLDKYLNRDFIQQKSPWLGVKAHYHFRDFPDNLVALHNFKGGYGGLSKTETGAVNFCYLAEYKTFKEAGNIENFNKNIVRQNPFLNLFLDKAEMIFEKPLGIAQISFQKKQAVENHMIMCGDTAGLIHPLCGNGMAMAIHSAKIAAEHISKYFKDKAYSRTQMEENYGAEWKKTFGRRLKMGRRLQSLLMMPAVSDTLITTVTRSPKLLQQLIKSTHGKPILS